MVILPFFQTNRIILILSVWSCTTFRPDVIVSKSQLSRLFFYTTVDIKKKCVSSGPKEVVSNIENSAGGILCATYPGQLPHNEQQISNFKHNTPVSTGQKLSGQGKSNEFYSIMLQAHLEEGSDTFLRDVKAYPDPAIVLASEQQLLRHCCDASHFSILTVDPTFSLGDFDVIPTTYEQGAEKTVIMKIQCDPCHNNSRNSKYLWFCFAQRCCLFTRCLSLFTICLRPKCELTFSFPTTSVLSSLW